MIPLDFANATNNTGLLNLATITMLATVASSLRTIDIICKISLIYIRVSAAISLRTVDFVSETSTPQLPVKSALPVLFVQTA